MDTGRWGYVRHPFIAFLVDREDEEQADPLVELRDLLTAVAEAVAAVAADDAVPTSIHPAVYLWGEVRGRSWFDFFRERVLLRGCEAADWCPNAPVGAPYSRVATASGDLYGVTYDGGRYWNMLSSPDDPYAFDSSPFPSGTAGFEVVDEGKSEVLVSECRFDTVKSLQLDLDSNASEIFASPTGAVELELAVQIQYPLSGVRLDVVDALDYSDGRKYPCELSLGPACVQSLRAEGWRWQEEPTTLAREGFTTSPNELLSFETQAPTDENLGIPLVALLIGNVATEPPADPDIPCTAALRIIGCPCATMTIAQDPRGAPGEQVLFCENGGQQHLLCNDTGLYAHGLLSPLEHGYCHALHAEMASFCGLGAEPPPP